MENRDLGKGSQRRRKEKRLRSWGFYGTPEWRALRKRVLAHYGLACMCCGMATKKTHQLHIDHIRPKSRYPELALAFANMQILCKPCHRMKGLRVIDYRPDPGTEMSA